MKRIAFVSFSTCIGLLAGAGALNGGQPLTLQVSPVMTAAPAVISVRAVIEASDENRALELGLTLPVCRVIVNQAHCFATGGSFDNGLPFSLSMGCGTWGGNSITDNLNYRNFINITHLVTTIPEDKPSEEALFGAYWKKYGK